MNGRAQLIALKAILWKEILRFSRIWVQTILPPMITTALYFVIFGRLIGSQISDVSGFHYMDYIVPGLILMAVITNSYGNVVASFYSAKFQHNIEEMLVSPLPNYLIMIGFIGGGLARGIAVGAAVTVVALFFTSIPLHNLWVAGSVLLLTSILFSLGGLINAIFANSFDDITVIPTFVLTPLTYLGGVFYTVAMLSPFWQSISLANPILYMVNAFRFGLLGVSDVNLVTAYLAMIGFNIGLFWYALYLLNRGYGVRT
ncbi:MAG: ABC transporter permease [Gallionellales bacterium 35-53-114]|jgi:ABC-2 type transport system permease protein|nr:MAG: ABC transporter permease [Gallionellales bacterium 35-53-114]OYZ63923.1 MAG: ABC transporter permease [Gallionellales bacterium 24-53-125]OZB09248.1 MAG: ABC transporter permease [Gallionellales bacterium 39-52-133]HQS59150.1 ABC transporter permease [Gallionellaceae bacterium]HQS75886.1 ABC transporter permease [Gallionellaceae bacterium]